MFLTSEELKQLTGYQKPSAQARWLEQAGISFLMGGDGKLKVLRLAVEQRLGLYRTAQPKREPQLRLDTQRGKQARRS
ncbi:DUF4224 domain-containing protein [Stutzerimonas stutzeri]|uniref:DUF4224 domain-containing protein n=1 Tax=Stutzerimonas stutzeri TaxID=316 RepID=UPI001F19D699|nr:DUF4224 domain-containing protein [Stutzerimonas stutzeri]